jgi:hypothetical protein
MNEKNVIIKEVLSPDTLSKLNYAIKSVLDCGEFLDEQSIGRKSFKMEACPMMSEVLFELLPLARRVFRSETLVPSYAFFAEYNTPESFLPKHKDNAGNTYNIDLCVYCDQEWPIYVEGSKFSFGVNEAVTILGEDQLHWRDKLGENNIVGNVFFFYVEPEHPYFTDPFFDKS